MASSDRLDNVILNIAVTGENGAGKSSFVNAIRGLKNTDEGAAPTNVIEGTREPTMYPHPTMPNVKLWDLPGTGGPDFRPENYLEEVKFENYDFFIIVCSGRFMENDMMLAKQIKKMKKNFYFVRTKTDIDVRNEETNGVPEEVTLQKTRNNCLTHLRILGPTPVFLITSENLERFDFKELVNTLERDLPDEKKDALVMSLPVYSKQSLDLKYKTLKKAAWAVAFASGGIAAAPVPGLSTAADVAMVVSFLTKCYYSFGLNDESLERLSKRVNKPILAMVRESELVMAIADKSSLATKIALRLGTAGVVEALCLLVPVAGNIAAAGISFVTTRSVLLEGLNELYNVAKRVIEMAELK